VQVLLFIAFSVVENTFSDTFEVRFHARVDLFLPQFIIVLQLYERTKHDHIDRNVCFLFVKIKCILLLLKLNSAFIQLFSFPRILSGSFYFSVWSSAGTFTLLLPIHHCFCYFYTSPFCWVYGFHRLSTLILIKEHDKYIKKSQVNMRLPCKIL